MAPATKRRKVLQNRVDELAFDPVARQEYLTGFHKRRLARVESARDAAAKREKELRVQERRRMREQRQEELNQRIQQVNEAIGAQNYALHQNEHGQLDDDDLESSHGEHERWDGLADPVETPELENEAEYVDEANYTTVTLEPMGEPDSMSEEDDPGLANSKSNVVSKGIRSESRASHGQSSKSEVKRRKFRYESKAERSATRKKQQVKGRVAKARRKGK